MSLAINETASVAKWFALNVIVLASIPGRVIQMTGKMIHTVPYLPFSTLGKSTGVWHTVLQESAPNLSIHGAYITGLAMGEKKQIWVPS